MTISELVVELCFKSDTKTLQSFIHDLGELNLRSVFAATGLAGLYEGINKIMEAADHTATALNNMMGITGVSAKAFQQWDNVAQQFGVTAGATSSAIAGIQSNIFELIRTGSGPGQMVGMLLGIDPRGYANHPEELLRKELEYLKQFDPATRRFYAQMLGISDEMLLLVDHTNELDHALANQAREFQEIARWHQIINKLAGDFRIIMVSLGSIIGPMITPLVDGITLIATAFERVLQVFPGWVQNLTAIAAIVAVIARFVNPWVALIAGAVSVAGFLSDKLHLTDILTPSTNSTSQFDNSKTIQMENNYNISGGNPQDVQRAIEHHWQKTTRESDLMGYQQNY